MFNKIKLLFFVLSLSIYGNIQATTYVLPPSGDLIGEIQQTNSQVGESIDEAGRRFNVGYYEMVSANPSVDPIHALPAHSRLIIPSQYILPAAPRVGIVINLAEYRLYYFPDHENVVFTFPVGIGKEGWNTPLGLTRITSKVTNPVWRPTAKVRAAAEEIGAPLPETFPAGINNPLGKHVLKLGWPTFLIHGTNREDGVGARVSAGCIRMLSSDIEYLFDLVPVGTPVRVINEPVKVGTQNGNIYIQIYKPLKGLQNLRLRDVLEEKLKKINKINWKYNLTLKKELSYPSGMVKYLK